MKSPQAKWVRLLQDGYKEHLEGMLKSLLRDETLSDITLHCKDGAVRAHRVILAASSTFFKKVFQEHPESQVAFIAHGISIKQMRSIIELIYKGNTQISSELADRLFEICSDFGIKGIIDNEKNSQSSSGRDTRFRGTKRVAVDYGHQKSQEMAKLGKGTMERRKSTDQLIKKTDDIVESPPASPPTSVPNYLESLGLISTVIKQEPDSPEPTVSSVSRPSCTISYDQKRRNNWAMKQRKYKCSLCTASFKRASHLNRHQLVHTGERPYSCEHCDKSFSRHDKLKHHIRKNHSMQYMGDSSPNDSNDLYMMGHVKLDNINCDISEDPPHITREDLLVQMAIKKEADAVIQPKESVSDCPKAGPAGGNTLVQVKKGRGRPRKYPPVPVPLVKRPRGRPRLNMSAPTITPGPAKNKRDNYDLTNMPFGDFEYLTKSFQSFDTNADNLMEPLVEIEMDQAEVKRVEQELQKEVSNKEEKVHHATAGSFLETIGLLENSSLSRMEIGECTVSVSTAAPV